MSMHEETLIHQIEGSEYVLNSVSNCPGVSV